MSVTHKLSDLERSRLTACEEQIESGIKTFVDVGDALLTIRDERLYRATHKAFDDYCRERWGMSRRHCNRLVGAAEVVREVGPIGPAPDSESVARPLTQLAPDDQRSAWQEAVDTAPDGKVTAKHVQEVVDRRTGKGTREKSVEVVNLDTGEVMQNAEVVTTTRTTRAADPDFPTLSQDDGIEIESEAKRRRDPDCKTVSLPHNAKKAARILRGYFNKQFLSALAKELETLVNKETL